MKYRLILYVILGIIGQVLLGYYSGQGQGGIAMLLFIIFVEVDPHFSFTYLLRRDRQMKKESK